MSTATTEATPFAKTVLLDTDVVIHLLRKKEQIIAQFVLHLQSGGVFLLSPIVIAEVYAGAFEKEYSDIERLFAFCETLNVDANMARQAGQYAKTFSKSHQGISLEDYLLAATAAKIQSALWTLNKKHYPMPKIIFWGAV